MQFAPLESYIVNQLTDKKEAAKLKLESPLGVAERFLDNYREASRLGQVRPEPVRRPPGQSGRPGEERARRAVEGKRGGPW